MGGGSTHTHEVVAGPIMDLLQFFHSFVSVFVFVDKRSSISYGAPRRTWRKRENLKYGTRRDTASCRARRVPLLTLNYQGLRRLCRYLSSPY